MVLKLGEGEKSFFFTGSSHKASTQTCNTCIRKTSVDKLGNKPRRGGGSNIESWALDKNSSPLWLTLVALY
jgi:hypothetical protein